MGNSMKKNKKKEETITNSTATTIPENKMPVQENGQHKNGSVVRRKKKGKKSKKDRKQKGLSCPPDIGGQSALNNGGATPYKGEPEETPKVEIKLYRSYADLDKFLEEKMRQSRPDLKVYRRSTGSLDRIRRDKTKSMPAGYDMDYSRDSGNESAAGSFLNGTVVSDSGTPGSASPNQHGPIATSTGPTTPVTPSNNMMPPKDGRRSNASSNSQSIPSVPESPLSNFDFPTSSEVRRKLLLFEDTFRRSLLFKYQSLGEHLQVSKVAVARAGFQGQREVSVQQYLDARAGVPLDLIKNYYTLMVPASVYKQLQFLKTKGIVDEKLWRAVTIDIVDSVGLEVGRELSRMYEYQIVSLAEDLSIQLLAAHATDCIMEYITITKVLLNRNSAIKGVVNVRPPPSEELNTVFSVFIGSKEHKWEIYDIFKKPGLRKEVEHTDAHNSSSEDEAILSSCDSPYPWKFHMAPVDCEPQKYGYRGQILEWNYAARVYALNPDETQLYGNTRAYHMTDIHQHYVPYCHVVTAESMQRYLEHLDKLPGAVGPPCVEFLKQDRRFVDRDGCELFLYRPQSPLGRDINWTKAVLENMDLTRLQIQSESSFCHSLRNSRLLLATITHAHMSPRPVITDGCDVSYATWVCFAGGISRRTKPHMICLEDVEDVDTRKTPGDTLIIDKEGRTVRVEEDIQRKEQQIAGGQSPPPPEVLVDYNYNVAERRSIHVLKTLQEDQPDGGATISSRASSTVSGPATLRRRKKRRKAGSSASDSSGQSSATNGTASEPSPGNKYVKVTQARDPARARPKSATLIREKTPDSMEAQQHLMQPRTPPLYGAYRQQPPKFHRRVMSSSNQAGLEQEALQQEQGNLNAGAPQTYQYQGPDGRMYTLPVVQKRRGENRHVTEGPVIPLDPKKDVLTDIEECPGAVYFNKTAARVVGQLFGRQDELARVAGLINHGTRSVTVTGCPGLGKSSFAVATAAALRDAAFLPVLVNARGCATWTRVCGRLMKQLGLKLPLQHVSMLKSWLASYDQNILLVVDNLELPDVEEQKVAEFLSALQETGNVHLLVTSRKELQHPGFGHVYNLDNITGASALALLRHQVPDLPDDTMEMLVILSEQVPYTLCLIAQGLRSGLMDPVEILNALQNHLRTFDEALDEKFRLYEDDYDMTQKLLSVVKTTLDYIPREHRELLSELTAFDSPVQLSTAKEILCKSKAANTLNSLMNEAPNFCIIDYDPVKDTVYVPDVVRHVLENGSSESTFQMCTDFCINTLNNQCKRYHSKDVFDALDSVSGDYDVVLDTLMDIAIREDMFDKVKLVTSQEMCMFLNHVLEVDEFTQLYESLAKQAQEVSDLPAECCVQCCLAYHMYDSGDYSGAISAGEQALRLQADCEAAGLKPPKDFCAVCLGKIYWRTADDDKDLKESGLKLVKSAVDSLKNSRGLQHILTVYAYEDYIIMEKDREHYQKARYLYNVLDFIADERLGLHPDRIRGYNSRREIWERQGLFVRAAEVAKKAAEASRGYYGEHVITANMYSHWCECLVKAGDAAEANRACAISLGMREKLLGIHKDTALSNKMYAYLMLRGGHYDHSLMYGQRALEMSQRLNTPQKFLKDLELILKHAYKRQQAMQAGGYIRMETQKGKRVSSCNPTKNGAVFDGNLNSISTEV